MSPSSKISEIYRYSYYYQSRCKKANLAIYQWNEHHPSQELYFEKTLNANECICA